MKAKIKINSKNQYTSFITIVSEILKTVDKKTVEGWCIYCSLTELNGKLLKRMIDKPIDKMTIKLDAFQTFTIYMTISNNSLELGGHEKSVAYHLLETVEKQYHREWSYHIQLINTISNYYPIEGFLE